MWIALTLKVSCLEKYVEKVEVEANYLAIWDVCLGQFVNVVKLIF